ncbi:hypothetical protein KDL45_04815 [bacterium]|nr:hypothetical protein [bacterium]
MTIQAVLVVALLAASATGAVAEDTDTSAWMRFGAAEADITPIVERYEDLNGNGRYDMGDPTQPFEFGDKVTRFREGEIMVGNGSGTALYVHGPLKTSVAVFEDPVTKTRVAYVSADLYLILQHDTEAIRARVPKSLGIDYLVVAPSHNHMGPDTLGMMGLSGKSVADILKIAYGPKTDAPSGINPIWFERFMDTIVQSLEKAVGSMQPARMRLGKTRFSFGMADEREPKIIDDDLMTMQLIGADQTPIATIVQGTCHPESVLIYGDERYTNVDYAGLSGRALEAWGRTLSPGFPGYVRKYVRENGGGVPLYFSGPVGAMVSNIFEKVWDPEAHPEYPITANPETVPEEIKVPTDYRMMHLMGREMGKAAMASLKDGETVDAGRVSYVRKEILVPLQNPMFRLISGMGILGYSQGALYDDQGRSDRDVSHMVRGLFAPGLQIPTGRNMKTEVALVNIGPAQFINIPAEIVGEMTRGLPDDFYTNVPKYFPDNPKAHPTGKDYVLQFPPLKKQSKSKYPFIIGLANSDMGYVIPACDFKPPHDLWMVPPFSFWWIAIDASGNPHYEESMTASKQMETRIVGALTELLSGAKE